MNTASFSNTISAREIQRRYRAIFNQVQKTNRPVIVITNNKPQAAIVSLKLLKKYDKAQQEQEAFSIIDTIRARNTKKKANKIHKEITQAVEKIRHTNHILTAHPARGIWKERKDLEHPAHWITETRKRQSLRIQQ